VRRGVIGSRVGGLDGCRGGWVLATLPVRGQVIEDDAVEVRVVPSVADVVRRLDVGELTAVAVDIPIGLAACGPRACDREARRLLGPRRSSVFPAPARAVLGTTTYEEACAVSRRVSGKGLSKQLFNIVPKIEEVDAVQSPGRQQSLFEACPELSFAVMAGDAPMQHSKRTPHGRAERVAALHEHLGVDVPALLETRAPGAQPDDVLDALALAWTARRYLGGSCLRLGGELDATGLRMEVVA
jgi:predicted RNase H-like nuclease